MDTTLNWLLVGAGDIARKRVAPALHGVLGSRIAAVCDLDGGQAREIASLYGAGRVYTQYEDALGDSSVDAVYIATPVFLHTSMAVRAIEAGKHVLVEKPLGLGGEDILPAVEAEERTTLACGCAYFRRFSSRYAMLRDMIGSGGFGDIVLVRMAYFSWFDPSRDDPKYWRVVRERSGGGPISDMGSHMFDVLIGLMGLPETVSAMTATLRRDWNVEDSAVVTMRMANGALVAAGLSWCSKTWVHMFEIVGTEAKVLWQPYDSGPVVKTVGRTSAEIELTNAENVHVPLVEDFIAAVREGKRPAVTFAEAAKTSRLMDAVYRASSEKREVAV